MPFPSIEVTSVQSVETGGEQGPRQRIEAALASSIEQFRVALGHTARETGDLVTVAANINAAGGKRIRAQLFYWGWRAAGQPDCNEIIDLAVLMEILHLFALVHDDVLDRSDTRRGVPTAHRQLSRLHRERGWRGDADHFGLSSSILLGDALLVWADMVIDSSDLLRNRMSRFRRAYDEMRLELVSGEYLDVLADRTGGVSTASALRLARLKSGNYSIGHPLRLGAIAGGADEGTLLGFARFGGWLGEAFQIHDDILGMFGRPSSTGKPVGDDLRQGKRTTLTVSAMDRATPAAARRLLELAGTPDLSEDEVDEARQIIRNCGALDAVRDLLADRTERALRALAEIPIDERFKEPLRELVEVSVGDTVKPGCV